MIHSLIGTNSYLQRSKKRAIIDSTIADGASVEYFNVAEIDDVDQVFMAANNASLFAAKKVIVLDQFTDNAQMTEKLQAWLESLDDDTSVILLANKIDSRTALAKFLKKHTVYISCNDMSPQEVERWILDTVTQRGGVCDAATARLLLDAVGSNQQRLSMEIDKLLSLNTTLTRQMVSDLVTATPQSKIFAMLDALFSGKQAAAERLYRDQRQQGMEPQQVIAMLVWQLAQLSYAVFASEQTQSTLQSYGMSPFAARKNLQLARRLNKSDMKYLVARLNDIDRATKKNADPESALSVYFSEVVATISS